MTEKDKGTKQRVETVKIGKAVYEIIAEEKDGASGTPLSILQRLIENYATENLTERTCCLKTDGGKANVGTNGNE